MATQPKAKPTPAPAQPVKPQSRKALGASMMALSQLATKKSTRGK